MGEFLTWEGGKKEYKVNHMNGAIGGLCYQPCT